MRFIKCWSILVALTVVTTVFFGQNVGASEGLWDEAFGVEREEINQSIFHGEICGGTPQYISTKEDGVVKACVYGLSTSFRFAEYKVAGLKKSVGAFAYDGSFVRLSVCISSEECSYSANYDRLFVSSSSGLLLYENFSKSLTLESVGDKPNSLFRSNTYSERIYTGDGKSLLGISENGRWVSFNAPGVGFGVYDNQLNSKKLVYKDSRSIRPGSSVAVTNNGRSIMTSYGGEPPYFIYINDCGVEFSLDFSEVGTQGLCSRSYAVANLMWYLVEVYKVRFSKDDTTLSVQGRDYAGKYRQTVLYSGETPPENRNDIDYLALGDSFTSGEGETDDSKYLKNTNDKYEKCHLSNRSYPFLLGDIWSKPSFSVACSGAVMLDVLGGANYMGQGGRLGPEGLGLGSENLLSIRSDAISNKIPGRIPQAEFVDYYRPKVVSIGIGGNDLGLMTKLKTCLSLGGCEWTTAEGKRKTVKELQRLKESYASFFSKLRAHYPKTAFLAVGYPLPIDEAGSCSLIDGTLLNTQERTYMNEVVNYMNIMMRLSAYGAGVSYVDANNIYDGNRLCQKSSTPAMNGLRLGDDIGLAWLKIIGAESFHPTPYGHGLMSKAIALKFPTIHDATQDCHCDDFDASVSAYWSESTPNADTPTPIYNPDIAKDTVQAKKSATVYIPENVFNGSSVELALRSEERVLLTTPGVYGGETFDVDIPALTSGYHTLVIKGVSGGGENIEIYKDIYVFDDTETVSETEQTVEHSAQDNNVELAEATDATSTTYTTNAVDATDTTSITSVTDAVDEFGVADMAVTDLLQNRVLGSISENFGAADARGDSKERSELQAKPDNGPFGWLTFLTILITSLAIWLYSRKKV